MRLSWALCVAAAVSATGSFNARLAQPSGLQSFTAVVTLVGTQGPVVSGAVTTSLAGRGISPALGKFSLSGTGRQTQARYHMQDDARVVLSFVDGGSIFGRLTGKDEFLKSGTIVRMTLKLVMVGGSGKFKHVRGTSRSRADCQNDLNSATLACTSTWKGTIAF